MAEKYPEIIHEYGVEAVFTWMFIAEIIPIPSAFAPMSAGFILIPESNVFQAFIQVFLLLGLLGSVASLMSSYIVYFVGRFGGRPVIEDYGKYVGVEMKRVEALENKLVSGNEHLYILVLRSIPIVPLSAVSAASGFFEVDSRKFGIWSFLGLVVRNVVLGMTGWYLAEDFDRIAELIGQTSTLIFVLLFGALAFYLYLGPVNLRNLTLESN